LKSPSHHPIKDKLSVFGPALLLVILGFLLAYQFVQPAPPDHIRIATGQNDGAYYLFAQRYQKILAREHIQLDLVQTEGSVDNIGLLESGSAEVAFVQGGTSEASKTDQLASLGSLYFEPIWVFHRKSLNIERLTQLVGHTISIGSEGSGTRALTKTLLGDNSITTSNTQLLGLNGRAAADALLKGELDAAFFIASPQSPVVRALLGADSIALMDFQRADAYTRLHRPLSSVTLPQGVISMQKNLPSKEITLLAASANLVVDKELHPALMDLLLQAAQEVHANGGWFEASGAFPSEEYIDFPLSKAAQRYYQYGPSFLQRYLPFWAATMVDRLKVMLLPLLALILPLVKIMPPLYRWRIRSRIYKSYREVLAIDRKINGADANLEALFEQLKKLENDVSEVSVPLSYAEELYDLRLHIGLVKTKLTQLRG